MRSCQLVCGWVDIERAGRQQHCVGFHLVEKGAYYMG